MTMRAPVDGRSQRRERLLVLALAVKALHLQGAHAAPGAGSSTPPRAFTRSTAQKMLRNTASPVLANGPEGLSISASLTGALPAAAAGAGRRRLRMADRQGQYRQSHGCTGCAPWAHGADFNPAAQSIHAWSFLKSTGRCLSAGVGAPLAAQCIGVTLMFFTPSPAAPLVRPPL